MMTQIRTYTAADAPWIVEQHATLYASEFGFDDSFGPLVSEILEDFNSTHDPDRERGWIAETADQVRLGCIFCVSRGPDMAKLRLFLLTPEARGQGLGKRLLETCMGFARKRGYAQMTLWTHAEHAAACKLYGAAGFTRTESKPVRSFGQSLTEESWTIAL